MYRWILGSKGTKKISLLYQAFSDNRIRKIESSRGIQVKYFHPLFSNTDNISEYTDDDIRFLAEKTSFANLREDLLRRKRALYEKPLNLELFSSQKNRYLINDSISRTDPNANTELNLALDMIRNFSPWQFQLLQNIVSEILPLQLTDGTGRFYGAFSDYDVLGAIFTSFSDGKHKVIDLSVSIIHELGHQALMVYQSAQPPIEDSEFKKQVYSGVRKTMRPTMGSYHAIVALTFMHEFYKSLAAKREKFSDLEYEYIHSQYQKNYRGLHDGLDAIRGVSLTQIGKKILNDVELSYRVNSIALK